MQERPQYKTTPEMGWSQMQPILDKAMPVEHRSRRTIVFWWVAAAMMIAISSLVLLNESRQPTQFQPVPTPSEDMASNDNVGQSTSSTPTDINKDKTTTDLNKATSTTKHTSGSTSTKTSSSTFTNKKITHNNKTPHVQIVESEKSNHAMSVVIAADKNEMVEPSSSPLSPDSNSKTATESSLITSRSNFSVVAFLPLAEGDEYAYTPDQINLVKPGKNTHRKSRFIPNISMAGMAGSQNGLGFSGGLGTDYVISSRFSVIASVGYRTYHPDVLNWGSSADYQLTEASNALLKDNYIVAEQLNAMADYNAINPFVHSINQWQVTAGMKYEITHRFFAESGVIFGFKTTAKSEYPIANSPLVFTPSGSNERSLDSYDIIRSNMTSIYFGGGYRASRRFDVFAQWVHGLDQYLLNDQISYTSTESKRSDYIRGIQIGLKYNL